MLALLRRSFASATLRPPSSSTALALCSRPSRSPLSFNPSFRCFSVSVCAKALGGRSGGMPPKGKFYAVRKGVKPGIYTTWDECKAQVHRFAGADHRGFSTLSEAQSWLAAAPQDGAASSGGDAAAPAGRKPAAAAAAAAAPPSDYQSLVSEELALHGERTRSERATGVLLPDPAAIAAAEAAYARRQESTAAASREYGALLEEEVAAFRGERRQGEAGGPRGGDAEMRDGEAAAAPAAKATAAVTVEAGPSPSSAGAVAAEPGNPPRKRGRPKKDKGDGAASDSAAALSSSSGEQAAAPESPRKSSKKAAKSDHASPKAGDGGGERKRKKRAASTSAATTAATVAELPEDLAAALAEALADDEAQQQRRRRAAAGPWLVRFDGGSRGNPGPAGCAAVLWDAASPAAGAQPVASAGVYVGLTTNNVAEYQGLISGLEMALMMGVEELVVEGDSELIIKQVLGQYKCRKAELQPLNTKAIALSKRFKRIEYKHIRREFNSVADAAANRVMDSRESFRDFTGLKGASGGAAA